MSNHVQFLLVGVSSWCLNKIAVSYEVWRSQRREAYIVHSWSSRNSINCQCFAVKRLADKLWSVEMTGMRRECPIVYPHRARRSAPGTILCMHCGASQICGLEASASAYQAEFSWRRAESKTRLTVVAYIEYALAITLVTRRDVAWLAYTLGRSLIRM